MARIRTIKPGYFKNEELAELPISARLLFIGLWCLADVEGRLEDRPKRIKVEIYPYDTVDIDNLLERLQSAGFIIRYEVGEMKVIQVLNFGKHQRITGTEAQSTSELPAVPDEWKHSGNILETFGNTKDDRKGKDIGKGYKEGKGRERKRSHHLFSDSEIFEKTFFNQKLLGTQYEAANIDYYHEVINNWSTGKGAKKLDWLATAKNWMAGDMRDGKFVTVNFKANGNNQTKAGAGTKLTGQQLNDAAAKRMEGM